MSLKDPKRQDLLDMLREAAKTQFPGLANLLPAVRATENELDALSKIAFGPRAYMGQLKIPGGAVKAGVPFTINGSFTANIDAQPPPVGSLMIECCTVGCNVRLAAPNASKLLETAKAVGWLEMSQTPEGYPRRCCAACADALRWAAER